MNMLIAMNTFMFLWLAWVWPKEGLYNASLKLLFLLFFACNAIAMFNVSGYVVRLHP